MILKTLSRMRYFPLFIGMRQSLSGSVRLYSRRSRGPEIKNKLKLATTVGSTKQTGSTLSRKPSPNIRVSDKRGPKIKTPAHRSKDKSRSTFNYGNFGGLKESGAEESQRASKIISKISDFDQLKVLPVVRNAIKQVIADESLAKGKIKDIKPSPIQVVSIRKLASNLMDPKLQLHAIAAETGSGKTIAYLTPLLDYLKRQEIETPEYWESINKKAVIRSVILVPTHELIEQVYSTVSRIDESLELHTCKWGSSLPYSDLLEQIKNRIDILVTTPAKLMSLFNIRMISRPDKILSQLKFVVLDEADTLLDQSWVEDMHAAIKKMPNTNHIVFCSATIPNEFNRTLGSLFPTVVSITTPRLHKLPNSLEFKVIDASLNPFKGSKVKALAQVMYAILNDGTEPNFEKRCIVFVNEKKDVSTLVEKLSTTYGHNCVGLTGDDKVSERLEKIAAFIQPPKVLETPQKTVQREADNTKIYKIPNSNILITSNEGEKSNIPPPSSRLRILVTTDLMARGLNFRGVKNVILYDVPKTSIDLVHRAGRTGRMKQRGRVFMLIDKTAKSWARGIPKIVKNSIALS
ncbi:hypothetical protein HG535_0B00920 [Zygotorulaspora mrakii]|uniref:RNA helicase n=1 Tax=Zygotorulaspora mrakii TaxID=42260 RepID=A0A7H9AY65_ZYGMR|nr:uncharacterized protein HG535_0B00920 [Zygotorulaspora mrakii]QLG71054.1 hypothetical protein HG535_0B00920 [Zygotorulaspora mrakii]